MSISRLKSRESSEVQGVVAITLAVLSQLVQFIITRLQESLIGTPLPNVDEAVNSSVLLIQNDTEPTEKMLVVNDAKEHTESNPNEDNNYTDLNDNNKFFDSEKENAENNAEVLNGPKKQRDKAKSLLTKLRRRKRRNSSDSEGSDAERTMLGSSSDEMNSDASETEDDGFSENGLSDDALSEDITDDQGVCAQTKTEEVTKEMNGHATTEKETEPMNTETVENDTQNGEKTCEEQEDPRTDQKDTVNNAEKVETVNNSTTFEENKNTANTVTYTAQLKKQSLESEEVLNMLIGKEVLASIKICFDWLRSNPDIIRICGKSSRTLLKRITILLNLINMDPESFGRNSNEDGTILCNADKLKECVKAVPLPEDVDLKGLNLLEVAHKPLNWRFLCKHKMNKREETLLRALKLIEFGHFLGSVEDAGVKYDETEKLFITVEVHNTNKPKPSGKDLDNEHPRGKLMRHMGKLWLKAEVRALETQLRSRLMSPYLVPDHEALAKHTPALKRLVYAKKFIVVIPTVVVSALDEVKRISGRAREATRWLETQLRRGSRFLRAQRPHERLALPLIKGPRPKDKEAWLFFQIIECCHYLTQQTKIGLTNDAEAPVVTLLTGCSSEDKKVLSFSPEGLAKSAGVNIEHIESFHTKWKASSKSHG